MATLKWPAKDAAEVMDYAIDWSPRLTTGETITASVFSVVGAIKESETLASLENKSIVWLSGGTAGTTAKITCTAETSGGRTFREAVDLPIVNRAA